MRIVLRVPIVACVALAVWLSLGVPARGQEGPSRPRVSVTPQTGFARVLFEWTGEAKASAALSNDVIVVQFDRPQEIDADAIARRLDGVAALVRQDTDGRALRIALKTPVRIASSHSGRRFALDIISPQRKGDPAPVEDPEAQKVKGPAAVDVRAAELETMTRLTFEWPDAVKYDTTLKNGQLTIRFLRPGTIDLSRLNARPPAWVKSASSSAGADTLTVTLAVDPEIRLSDKVDGGRVTVDLIEPAQDGAAAAAAPVPAPPPAAPSPLPAPAAIVTAAAGQGPKQLIKTDAHAVTAHQPPPSPGAPTGLRPTSDATAPATAPATTDLSAAQAAPDGPPLTPGTMRAELKGANAIISAPFKRLPKAAIFRRGPAIWMIFETSETLDAGDLVKLGGAGVRMWSAPQQLQPGVMGLRLRAPEDTPVSAQAFDAAWVLTIGPDAAPEAGGVTFLREVQGPAFARLRTLLSNAGQTVWVKDPDLGDRIAITPAGAPLRGVTQGRKLAEFEILPSLHGLAVRAISDDLQVAADGGAVTIGRPKGLAMTRDAQRPEDFSGPVPDSEFPAADLAAWKRLGDDPATAARTLLRASADAPPGMSQHRMNLARYYVANDLGAEALGVMRLIVGQDQTAEQTPALRTLRAIANLQMRRPKEAADDLNIAALARDPHAAFWRGIAFGGMGKHAEARANLLIAAKYFGAYPPAWQARARLALADASLALGDPIDADRAVSVMPQDLPGDLAATFRLMRGRVLEAQNKDEAALSAYAEAMGAGHPETAVRAELQATLLKARNKTITPDQAADQLERLRYKWRGDTIELATLRALGLQYVAMGRVREGLDAMNMAVRNFPDTDDTRQLQLDMQRAFASIFLEGKTDQMPPVKALALFYDYKHLTPPGLEGDELLRKLTERLADADLLPQAAELLQHQVDNRLDGVARAQVATRLAVIYLLDRKPEKALNAIRSSRQVRLPDAMIAERRLIEARALTDLNLTDEAIESLADDSGAAAQRLRADVFWAGQRWREAGKASETLAGDRWNAPQPLGDIERGDVLRAAVAYVLANDRAGVERLRTRFGPKMADSKDARSFAVVVGETNPASPDMRAMVRQVASADSLDAFLKDLKSRKDPIAN